MLEGHVVASSNLAGGTNATVVQRRNVSLIRRRSGYHNSPVAPISKDIENYFYINTNMNDLIKTATKFLLNEEVSTDINEANVNLKKDSDYIVDSIMNQLLNRKEIAPDRFLEAITNIQNDYVKNIQTYSPILKFFNCVHGERQDILNALKKLVRETENEIDREELEEIISIVRTLTSGATSLYHN
jgi:hypothetical protein